MSASSLAVAVLISAGLVVEAVAVLGAVALPSTLDRAHMLGPASILGPLLIVTAVVVQEQLSPLGVKALLILVVLWMATPVLGHATARAVVLRARRQRRPLRGAPEIDA